MQPRQYSLSWLLLSAFSLFMASINLRLPQTAVVVISMGDVFTILALMYFGPGPALVTFWADTATAALTDYTRRHGLKFYRNVRLHRFIFNLAACPLAMLAMSLV